MKIHEWEVWHCYSTSLPNTAPDLDSTAHRAVASGVSSAAILSSGDGFARVDGQVRSFSISLLQHIPGTVNLPADLADASGYTVESIYHALQMRASEKKLFAQHESLPPRYLRVLLEPYLLVNPQRATRVYPYIKLYNNGIVTVSFRAMSPEDDAVDIDDFIAEFINLSQDHFREGSGPAGVSRLIPVATRLGHGSSLRSRLVDALRTRGHYRGVAELTETENVGDFQHRLAPIARDGPVSLPAAAQELFAVASLLTVDHPLLVAEPNGPGGGNEVHEVRVPGLGDVARYTLWGDPPGAGAHGYWFGHAHAHLRRHEDQARSARVNEMRWGEKFGAIMARTKKFSDQVARSFLPQDMRRRQDYSVYTNKAVTLWVHAGKGLQEQAQTMPTDRNRGPLIYEHQCVGELMDYGYAAHHQLAQRASEPAVDMDDVLGARRTLVELRQAMLTPAYYGEIKELLHEGWDAMGAGELDETIEEWLSVRESSARLSEQRRNHRLGVAISLVVAVAALLPLANNMVGPIWKWMGLPVPATQGTSQVLFIGVAGAFLLSLILWALYPRADSQP